MTRATSSGIAFSSEPPNSPVEAGAIGIESLQSKPDGTRFLHLESPTGPFSIAQFETAIWLWKAKLQTLARLLLSRLSCRGASPATPVAGSLTARPAALLWPFFFSSLLALLLRITQARSTPHHHHIAAAAIASSADHSLCDHLSAERYSPSAHRRRTC